jgi:hypothetical protein
MTGTEWYDINPKVEWNAPGGPEIVCADGTIQKLNFLERLYFRIGILSTRELNLRYCKEDKKGW